MLKHKSEWSTTVLALSGVGFWFLLAFPFGNRNESYTWIAYLEQCSFFEIITNPIPSIRTPRPLAQMITWVLYRVSGNTGTLVQLVNFILLCVSFILIINLSEIGKRVYAGALYFLIGFVFISVFYFIFNLHGIFYSPILLYIALLLRSGVVLLQRWKIWSLITLFLTLFHPFIAIFYAAFLTGLFIEKEKVKYQQLLILAITITALGIFTNLLLPFPILSVIDIQNLLGTLRNAEAHTIILAFIILLSLATLYQKPRQQQFVSLGCILVYLPFAYLFELPLLPLLGFLLLLHQFIERKWSLIGLLVASILFPLAVGSGSPTKASVFIFLTPYLLLRQIAFPQKIQPKFVHALSFILLTGMVTVVILVRTGIELPFLSNVVKPVLVEKGKTLQLKAALTLALEQQPFKHISFLQEKQNNIRDKGQPKQRDFFPPTRQKELDVYQNFLLKESISMHEEWYASFGATVQADTLQLVHTIKETHCRPLYLYEPVKKKP